MATFAAPRVKVVVKTQSAAASFVSVPSGMRLSEPATAFESATVSRQHRPLDEVVRRSRDDGGRDPALVGERVEQGAVVGIDQRQPVGSAVLGIGGDDQVRARVERAGERSRSGISRVGAVDEDERDPGEVDRGRAGVIQLHEAVAVGPDLVVVDLVQDEARRRRWRRRWRRRHSPATQRKSTVSSPAKSSSTSPPARRR